MRGEVFVRGDEAPTGTDPNTNKSYTGQPAMTLEEGAVLQLEDNATLGLYGGGRSALTSHGGTALTLKENSKVIGNGKLIAVAGETRIGDGTDAVAGTGKLAVKKLYLQGGNTYDYKANGGKGRSCNSVFDQGRNGPIW